MPKFSTPPTRFSYQAAQLKELFKYSITRLSDGKEVYVDRRPRRGSKWWGFEYLVWDNKNNCRA